jgi:hypothetical protein
MSTVVELEPLQSNPPDVYRLQSSNMITDTHYESVIQKELIHDKQKSCWFHIVSCICRLLCCPLLVKYLYDCFCSCFNVENMNPSNTVHNIITGLVEQECECISA